MPPRCVLNGLQTIPIPEELKRLDELSKQLIQRPRLSRQLSAWYLHQEGTNLQLTESL